MGGWSIMPKIFAQYCISSMCYTIKPLAGQGREKRGWTESIFLCDVHTGKPQVHPTFHMKKRFKNAIFLASNSACDNLFSPLLSDVTIFGTIVLGIVCLLDHCAYCLCCTICSSGEGQTNHPILPKTHL